MSRRTTVVCIASALLAAALAGCTNGEPDPESPAPVEDDPAQDEPVEPERFTGPISRDLYLAGGGELAASPPAAASVPIGVPIDQYFTGIEGAPFSSAPFQADALLHPVAMRVVLNVEVDAAAIGNGQFDIGAWAGTTTTLATGWFGGLPAPVQSPGVLRFEFDLDWSEQVGIHVPAGEALRILVIGPMTDPLEATAPRLLLGGDDPSRINMTWSVYNQALPTGEETVTELSGSLTQTQTFTDCDNQPGTTSQTHDVAVPIDAKWLAISVRAEGTGASRDLDVFLHDGTRVLQVGRGPGSGDQLLLAGVLLEPFWGRDLQVRIVECQAGETDYVATVAMRA